jgi:beta-lactamase superfamily II metal-dependent hydrolase
MKITFKDVGQGDSIIIEWQDKAGVKKIGVVDCKLKGKVNPVLEYIKTTDYKEIAFLILSHPHEDHYSGYLELLEHLEEKNIPIIRMGHTLFFGGVGSYWKYFEVSTKATDLLSSIKKKWLELEGKKFIRRMDALNDGKVLRIDDSLTITSIAPSPAETRLYYERVKLDEITNAKTASQAANLFSTVLRLTFDDYNYLLTSDAENSALIGSMEKEPHHFEGVKYHVCQMAHHGSAKNYTTEFWGKIDAFKVQNAIASAGNGYRHPSFKVLKNFYDGGYAVYCTNIVNGMNEFVKMLDKKSKALDSTSRLAEEYLKSNDRVFEIKDGQVLLTSTGAS